MRFKTTKRLLLVFIMLSSLVLNAQEVTVSGVVTSSEDGLPMPGVSIIVVGTTKGTSTDFDGNFSIDASKGDKLEFNFIGYSNKMITVSKSIENVVMMPDTKALSEIVVTALGISREKKSLGYSVQEVSGSELNKAKAENVVNSISGKVAGVQIKTSTNMGGSSSIVIRGSSSLTGDNQALFVIDGVPVNNNTNNDAGQTTGRAGFDYGNPVSDLNPDDIESMNVLKGAAATALYGSRAANGVILITTKKGTNSEDSVVRVGINSSVLIGIVDRSTFPTYQTNYGAGYGPFYSDSDHPGLEYRDIDGDGKKDYVVPSTEDASFGARFDPNLMVYQWDSFYPESPTYRKKSSFINAKNGPISFFENSLSLTNGFNISGGTKVSTFYLSYTNTNQSGILPNSTINKNNVTFNSSYKLNDKLKVSASANYINTKGKGRNSTGYSGNQMSSFRQWWQLNVDVQQLKELYESTGKNITWNPKSDTNLAPIYWDNPYWQRYENYQNDERNRIIGYAQVDWDITKNISFMGRTSIDSYSTVQEERKAVGSIAGEFGVGRPEVSSGYARRDIKFMETNIDAMLKFNKNITENLNVTALLGSNIRRSKNDFVYVSTNGGLVIPGVYALSNGAEPMLPPSERLEEIGVNGLFASASLGYLNTFFLDATIRRDVSSTLPIANNSYIYPSVSGSFIFSEILKYDWLELGKVRLNYAKVGNDAPWGSTVDTYVVEAPFGTSTLVSARSRKRNENLKPELSTSIEAGLEMNFFHNRFGFDLAYYKTNTVDQIVPLSVSLATGYSSKFVNVGEVQNQGIEIMLRGTAIKINDFSWDVMVNFSRNRNKVVSLGDNIDNLQIASLQGGITINAREGEPYGAIEGTDYVYDKYVDADKKIPADGARRVIEENGHYLITSTSDRVIGNVQPDFNAGLNNSFRYKNFTASFLIDMQWGGQIWSLDQWYGRATGLYAETDFTNDLGNPVRNSLENGGGLILPGVVDNGDGTFSENKKRISADSFRTFGYSGNPSAGFIYDASYVKLREASISYTLPKSLVEKAYLKGATFSIVGSNLWILYKDLPHADPEASQGAGNVQGWQSGALPTTRNFGFNVNLQF